MVVPVGVRGNEILMVLDETFHRSCSCRTSTGKKDFFDCVQALEGPGLGERLEVTTEQPQVHEGLVLLVRNVGLDDLVEEGLILVEEKEIQLVTGVTTVFLQLFRLLHPGPAKEKGKLVQVLVVVREGE